MTRLTLCMIVRDEEALLPGCLASVLGFVDEIVVVDTGSTDRTVEIAERAGARVIRRPWDEDFSAARNASIASVREGFVLMLDADERLVPGAGEALRAEIELDAIDLGMLPLHNANSLDATLEEVLSGAKRLAAPVLLGRLLRRTDDLAWEGVIHEHVTRWALRHTRHKQLDAAIVHYGAVPALRASRKKNERNLQLLERRCKAEPHNPMALTYLAQELARTGDTARALEIAERAWQALLSIRSSPGAEAVAVATTRATFLLHAGRIDDVHTTLAEGERRAGEHPNFLLLRAIALEHQWVRDANGDPHSPLLERAEAACSRCLELEGVPFPGEVVPGTTTWSSETRLGIVRLLGRKPERALSAFDRALGSRPQDVEARLGRIEALLALDHAPQALTEVAPLLHPDLPDGWILAAAAGLACEGFASIAPIAGRARQALAVRPPLAPHRRKLLEDIEAHAPSALPSTRSAIHEPH